MSQQSQTALHQVGKLWDIYLTDTHNLVWTRSTDIAGEDGVVEAAMFLQVTYPAVDYCAYGAGVFGSIAHEATVNGIDDSWRCGDEKNGA